MNPIFYNYVGKYIHELFQPNASGYLEVQKRSKIFLNAILQYFINQLFDLAYVYVLHHFPWQRPVIKFKKIKYFLISDLRIHGEN